MLTCTLGWQSFFQSPPFPLSLKRRPASCCLRRWRLTLMSTAGLPSAVTMVKCGSNAGIHIREVADVDRTTDGEFLTKIATDLLLIVGLAADQSQIQLMYCGKKSRVIG